MYSNILVPVAASDKTDFETPVRIAQSLADEGAKITLVHVFETLPAFVAQQVPSDILEANRKETRANMDAAAAAVPGGQVALLEGSPGRTITDYVSDHGVDLVVMASHRPGMGDILWGSTAGFVVRHVPCAVHVVR